MSTPDTTPTLWSIARRPRWIGALALALALAAGFAALGQWQLERGVASATVIERETEKVQPLSQITSPQLPTNTAADGQRVVATGKFAPGSWIVLDGRSSGTTGGDGGDGAWVVGRFLTDAADGAAAVAVAVGWAPTVADAASVADSLDAAMDGDPVAGATTIIGRYLPGEPPQLDDFENGELSSLSPPALVNLWPGAVQPVYGGYIVPDAAVAGLDPISASAPSGEVQLNWLNIFYAVEWVVFAAFAVYMWFRLVKDAWERETEADDDDDGDASDADADADADAAGISPALEEKHTGR